MNGDKIMKKEIYGTLGTMVGSMMNDISKGFFITSGIIISYKILW